MNRREFFKTSLAAVSAVSLGGCSLLKSPNNTYAQKPNVLFLCIDDLNNWVGYMNCHPDIKTPNIDKLASWGTAFMNAHCAAPLCAPSRTAMISGRSPYNTGVYKNGDRFDYSEVLKDAFLMPKNFSDNGYYVAGTGKIYHEGDQNRAGFDEYWPSLKNPNPETFMPPEDRMPLHGMPVPKKAWGNDWGPLACNNEQMGDWKTAGWVADKLKAANMAQPFFLAWGCKLPHVPLYAPQKYFDMYPIDEISMPKIKDDDLDDVPAAAKDIGSYSWWWKPHEYIKKYNQEKKHVQAYLACISFVDDCVGRILDALDESGYKDNTVIVFVSDHGMHKGEKENWSKYTLWQEATNVPMIFSGAGIKAGEVCDEPVSLIDLYPTFIDMCGLTKLENLDGQTMMPLLQNPRKDFGRMSITTYGKNLNSVRSRQWRYIRYADGSEELYNHIEDPYEWNNLAAYEKYEHIKQQLAKYIPTNQLNPVIRKR